MTSAVDGGPVRARAGWAWRAVAGLLLLLATLAPEPAHAQIGSDGICGRTPVVLDAILSLLAVEDDVRRLCTHVVNADLHVITGVLELTSQGITALNPGDFDGLIALTELRLSDNDLTELPAGVFDELTSLEALSLNTNELPAGVFDELTALTRLHLSHSNGLTELPAGVFDELTSLRFLLLDSTGLTELPAGVFDELTSLIELFLNSNDLTELPAGVFDELTSLTGLFLHSNDLTELPAGVFDELTSLTTLWLQDNPGAPFAPTAVALPDDGTISPAGGTVTLDGSGSGGAWGTNVTYSWALTNPASGVTVTFDNNASAKPVVTIPALTEDTELTFTLTVTGRGTNGIAPATDTAKVTATANTAPTATDTTVSTDEDTTYDFDAGDFNFTDKDTGDTLASVKITSLPASGKGSLTLDGSAVSADQVVSRADIDADKLVYTPPANANGDDYASFGFKVSDGTNESASAYTMTIDVTAVNDAATGEPAISGTARVGSALTAAKGTIADVDGLTSVSYSYQWIRVDGTDETDITGATSSTYTLVAAEQGKKVKVRLGFTDDGGTGEARTSAAYPDGATVVPAPAVLISGADGLTTGEDGTTATFQVRLAAAPANEVTVTPSSSDTGEGTVSGALTFTTTNWNTARTVTVTGVDDADVDGEQTFSITFRVESTDPDYAGISVPAVSVTNADDESLALNLDAIAGDDTVNIAEKAAGFAISGATGSEGSVSVSVTLGSQSPLTATSDAGGAWSVAVPADAAYLTGTSVAVTVSASKTGYTAPSDVTRALAVDLTAPSATYTAPSSLQVGVAVSAMTPSTTDTDIASYGATGLPPGLGIDAGTGVVSGTPGTADANTADATVTVTDRAGNPATVSITFPAVARGNQLLTGFAYSPATVTYGDTAPTVTAPSGVQTTLSYSATPSDVCTVDSSTGALTPVEVGACVITATAAGTADWNQATATFTVRVAAAGALALNLDAIARDDTVNIAEKAAGFAIGGDTGSEAGVTVSVTIGTESPLTATSDAGGAWSVAVPADAAYLTGTSVAVTVSASKTGYTAPSDVTRALAVDLTAPSATYTAPSSLQVGVAVSAMTPSTTDTDIASYGATGLPPGLGIDSTTGAISGTPDTADANTADATVTVTDRAGNPATVSITFPAVARGNQLLTGFAYSPATVTYGDTAPTVTAPSGVQTTLSYSATPSDVCTVDSSTGALTPVEVGACVITATAAGTADWNQATATFTVRVAAAGALALNLDAIAGDDTVNIAEKAAGFTISGDTGSEGGVSVSVTLGSQSPLTATSDAGGAWSVAVPANAAYITGTGVAVTVSASKTGYTAPSDVTRALAVDLTAPSATYTAPSSLQVGVAVSAMTPSTTDTDIASYGATGLPPGLGIDAGTGVVSGTPGTADANTADATVTVTDRAGNPATVSIAFPAVAKGNQTLTGFAYSSATVTYGDTAPTVTAPSGVQTTLSYSATPSDVCTVDSSTGALTPVEVGACVITATAAGTADWNQATATFTVRVAAAGALDLNLDAIAGDDTVNIAEKAAGFTIGGATGSEGGVSVSVTLGSQSPLTATSDAGGAWSVAVPADAAYLTGTSVAVTVSASKTGYTAPSDVTRALAVDLTAPSATYTAPSSLQVGVAVSAMTPSTTDTDIASYGATGLPPGLGIDSTTGAISGTPDTADANTADATVTVTDRAGNPATVSITFPAVARGNQLLTGFAYSPATVTYGDTAPTVTAPSGVQTTLSYSATPSDVCTVDSSTGALTPVEVGACVITATAAGTADWNQATATFTVRVAAAGALALNLDAIAGDDTVNIAEKAAGFTISGDTGSEGGVSVSVTLGSQSPLTATSDAGGAWSVAVPANAAYITGTGVAVTVSASKTGYTAPSDVTRALAVDLTAPSATYTAPSSLQVGVAVSAMTPSTTDTDIASYGATGLPPGLGIDAGTGVVSGTPDTADANTASATVTVTDRAGNPATVSITFPAVAKGNQTLTGFAYSSATVTYGDTAPTVTAPTGVQTTLSYSAAPEGVCTVDSSTGALTPVEVGACVITATAAGTADWNQATATFTVTVAAAGALALNLDTIAGDDTVNIAEKAAGFTISGATGTESGVSVSVTVGTTDLTATSAAADPATWSVSVPPGASYLTGASVAVTVSASKTGYTAPSDVTRTLAVDLTAPAASYTAPSSLQVGVAIGAMTPSTTATDIASYGATGLPSGLGIDTGTGVVSGTPDTADANTASATVTVTDRAGNPATVSIAFPAVAKGNQTLTGFAYSSATVTYGDTAPTVTAPTGVQTTLSYSAAPEGVCTVDSSTGALTPVEVGACVITATAAGTADWNQATATFTVTVAAAGALALNLDTIAGDDTVNIAEKAAGFTISGATGTESGVSVTVTVGSTPLTATSDAGGAWSVAVPANAAYITGTSVAVTVSASKTGYTAPSDVTRALAVDLTAPAATYTAPSSLQVGVAVSAMTPSTTDTDIASYGATGLPSGLGIDTGTGVVSGTPDTADANTAAATVTVTDRAGNPATVSITFPAVARGNQTLTGFAYSSATATYGDTSPTVTAPSGVQTTLSYSATPATVCTVDASTGALTLVGVGDCNITATAAGTANYNEATAAFTVTVQAAGALALNLDTIAGDDTVNIAEKAAGFTISGDTGSEAGVSVTVTVGGTELTATSAAGGAWSVAVPANATYITGTSVTVTVSASKTGFTSPSDVTRTLAVDLTAPAASYTAPSSLQVGVAIGAMTPSTTATDIASYGATGLPPGLGIDAGTGVVSGTPDTADANTADATVTVTDTAGNPATVSIAFPAVARGNQTLTGFAYSSATVTYGDTSPTVTAPSGVQTTLSYSAAPEGVCTVDSSTGALTLAGVGSCAVTATAAPSDDYNQGTATFTVTVPELTLVSVWDAQAGEGKEMTFTVRLSKTTGTNVTVDWTALIESGDTAAAEDLGSTTRGTVTIAAGSRTGTFRVATVDDTTDEENETFSVRLSNLSSNSEIGDPTATGTIIDDDVSPFEPATIRSVTVVSGPGSDGVWGAGERVELEVRYSLPVAVEQPEYWENADGDRHPPGPFVWVTFFDDAPGYGEVLSGALVPYAGGSGTDRLRFSYRVGAAEAGARGVAVADGTLLLRGATIRTLEGGDGEPEFTRTRVFHVNVRAPAGGDGAWTAGDTVQVEVTFTGPASGPYNQMPNWEEVVVDETGGTPSIGVRLGDGKSRPLARTASYETGSRTNTLTFEYAVTAGDGRVSAVEVVADSLARNGATMRNEQGYDAELDHLGTLRYASLAALLVRNAAAAREGGTLKFTMELARASEAPVTVDYATAGGTATAGKDYTAKRGTVTFAPGQTRKTVEVRVLRDEEAEDTETVVLRLSNAHSSGSEAPVEVTVPEAKGMIEDVAPEAPSGVLTARFARAPAEHDGKTAFKLLVAFSEGISIGFRTFRDQSLSVSGGSVKKAKRVDRRRDLWEVTVKPGSFGDVTVTLAGGRACGIAGAVCTGDGRALSATISTVVLGPAALSVADARVREAEDAVLVFQVTLDRARHAAVTVDYVTSDVTARAGEDYTSASGTLRFATGERSKTVEVTVLDDAHDEGEETLTLTLSNPSGAYLADATATGTIENTDHMPKAWMVRFGRTVGSQVVDALNARLDGAGGSHVTVAGINLVGAPGLEPQAEDDDPFGLPEWAKNAEREADARTITAEDIRLRSAFHLSSGGDGTHGGGPAFTAWGRVATGGFEAEEDGVTMDGDVTTGLVGFDAEWERALAGIMLSQSSGDGSYRLDPAKGDDAGTVESSLTGVYPYARVDLDAKVSAWALAGVGSGELTLRQTGKKAMPTDISMRMGAVGVKGKVLDGTGASGVSLDVKTDAMWVGTKSERTNDMVATEGDVMRLRLILQGERIFEGGDGATFTPSAEVGLRHDGGDAETGTGVEVGAGLRYTAGAVTIEAQARTLLVHEASGYEDWGASGAIRVTPDASGRGLTLSIAPVWGRTGSAAERLWSAHDARALGEDSEFEADSRLVIDAGYGIGLAHRRGVLTPYAGLTLGDAGNRTVRTGTRWQLGPDAMVALEGFRQTSRAGEADNRLMLRVALRF